MNQIIFRLHALNTIRDQDGKPVITYSDIGYTYLYRLVEAGFNVRALSIGGMNCGILGDPQGRWFKIAEVFNTPNTNPDDFINVVCGMSLEEIETLIVPGHINIAIVAKEIAKPGYDFLMVRADHTKYDYIITPSQLGFVPELTHAQWHIVAPKLEHVKEWFSTL